ncbi:WRKY transcription factor [Orobanche gracilis]
MENFPSDFDIENLTEELSQGRDLTMQLQNHLHVQSSPSREICEFLLHKILYSYDQALSMLRNRSRRPATATGEAPPSGIFPAAATSNQDSSRALPRDDSDQDFKDRSARKRKAIERWTEKVKVLPEETRNEGLIDDGYNWRKYGQKDILGAKYPRGYYRCTYRHGQGCLATKQVQRSDQDPTIYEIKYRRKHTCIPRAHPVNNPVNNPVNDNNDNNPPLGMPDPQYKNPNPLIQNPHEPNFNTQTNLGVVTQDFGTKPSFGFDPFNFHSSSAINSKSNHIFSDSGNILGNYSPNLFSPATSGSNHFTILTDIADSNFGISNPNTNTCECELNPIVAAITSTSNSSDSNIGTTFSFHPSDFGSDFGFGNRGYQP